MQRNCCVLFIALLGGLFLGQTLIEIPSWDPEEPIEDEIDLPDIFTNSTEDTEMTKRLYFTKIDGGNEDLVNLTAFGNIVEYLGVLYWGDGTADTVYAKSSDSPQGPTITEDTLDDTDVGYAFTYVNSVARVSGGNLYISHVVYADGSVNAKLVVHKYDGTSWTSIIVVLPIDHTKTSVRIHDVVYADGEVYFIVMLPITQFPSDVYILYAIDETTTSLEGIRLMALPDAFYRGKKTDNDYYYCYSYSGAGNLLRLEKYDFSTTITTLIEVLTINAPVSVDPDVQGYWNIGDVELMVDLEFVRLRYQGGNWTVHVITDANGVGIIYDFDPDGNVIPKYLMFNDGIWEISAKGVLKKIQGIEPRDYKLEYPNLNNEELLGVIQFLNKNGLTDLSDWTITNEVSVMEEFDNAKKVLRLDGQDVGKSTAFYPFDVVETDLSFEFYWGKSVVSDYWSLIEFRESGADRVRLLFEAGKFQYHNGVGWQDVKTNLSANTKYHHKLIFDDTANTFDWYIDGDLQGGGGYSYYANSTTGINQFYIDTEINQANWYCIIDSIGYGDYVVGSNKKINAYVGWGTKVGDAWFTTGDAETGIMRLEYLAYDKGTIKNLVEAESYAAPKCQLIRKVPPVVNEYPKLFTDDFQQFYEGFIDHYDTDNKFLWIYLMRSWEMEFKKTKMTLNATYTYKELMEYVIDTYSKWLSYGRGTNGNVVEISENRSYDFKLTTAGIAKSGVLQFGTHIDPQWNNALDSDYPFEDESGDDCRVYLKKLYDIYENTLVLDDQSAANKCTAKHLFTGQTDSALEVLFAVSDATYESHIYFYKDDFVGGDHAMLFRVDAEYLQYRNDSDVWTNIVEILDETVYYLQIEWEATTHTFNLWLNGIPYLTDELWNANRDYVGTLVFGTSDGDSGYQMMLFAVHLLFYGGSSGDILTRDLFRAIGLYDFKLDAEGEAKTGVVQVGTYIADIFQTYDFKKSDVAQSVAKDFVKQWDLTTDLDSAPYSKTGTDASCTVEIYDGAIGGHQLPLELDDQNAAGNCEFQIDITPTASDFREFFVRTTNAAYYAYIYISDGSTANGVYFRIRADNFQDGTTDTNIVAALDNTWYHIKLIFNTATWTVVIGSTTYGPYAVQGAPTSFDRIILQTRASESGLQIYYDGLSEDGYTAGDNQLVAGWLEKGIMSVEESYASHKNMVYANNTTAGTLEPLYAFSETSGALEFNMGDYNGTRPYILIPNNSGQACIRIALVSAVLIRIYHAATWTDVAITSGSFPHIRAEFEMITHTQTVYVNNILEVDGLAFYNSYVGTTLESFTISLSAGASLKVDALWFSWDGGSAGDNKIGWNQAWQDISDGDSEISYVESQSFYNSYSLENEFFENLLKLTDGGSLQAKIKREDFSDLIFSFWTANDDVTDEAKIEFYEGATLIGYILIDADNLYWYDGGNNLLQAVTDEYMYHLALQFSASADNVEIYINGSSNSTQSLDNNITTNIDTIIISTGTTDSGHNFYISEIYHGDSLVAAMNTLSSISPLLNTDIAFKLDAMTFPVLFEQLAEETAYFVSIRPDGQLYVDQYSPSGKTIIFGQSNITFATKLQVRNIKFSFIRLYGGFFEGQQISAEDYGEPNFGDYEDWYPGVSDVTRLQTMVTQAIASKNITIKKQEIGIRSEGYMNAGTSFQYTNSEYGISDETYNIWRKVTYNGKINENIIEIADSFISPTDSDPEDSPERILSQGITTNERKIVKLEQAVGQGATRLKARDVLTAYIEKNQRNLNEHLWGFFTVLTTAQPLDNVNPINVTAGCHRILIVVNAGTDLIGTIRITGDTRDRTDTSSLTVGDTEDIEVDELSTDNPTADTEGNTVYDLQDVYMSNNWFEDAIVLSTTDLTLTDVDVYAILYHQFDDFSYVRLETFDFTALVTNNAGWFYGYLYLISCVTDKKYDIENIVAHEIPSALTTANLGYRRRKKIQQVIDGSAGQGIWLEIFFGPAASAYWQDIAMYITALIDDEDPRI